MKGRLYDKLLAGLAQATRHNSQVLKAGDGHEWGLALRMLRGAVVIDANDVADYQFGQSAKPRFNLYEDFLNVAPPFPSMFFEFGRIDRVNPDGMVVNCRMEDQNPRSHGVAANYEPSRDAAGWKLSLRWFAETEERRLRMCPWDILAQVSPEGRIVGNIYSATTSKYEGPFDVFPTATVALRAICFMHCKNAVEIVDNTPNPEKSEAHRKRYGVPLCSHKTLVVRPVRKMRAIREAAQARGEPVDLRMHQVRGHFKRYTAEAPLLGRHVGTYFWADQLRGNPDLGVIEKDYKVETNAAAPPADELAGQEAT